MADSQHPLFRERAIEQYIRGQIKDVLPRLTISTTLCVVLWILLGVLFVALWLVVVSLNRTIGGV